MGKKLPGIFSNKINKKLNNNDEYFVSNNSNINYKLSKEEVKEKINNILNSSDFVYRVNVLIALKDKNITRKIIALKDDNLLTIDGEYIKLDDILDINIKD